MATQHCYTTEDDCRVCDPIPGTPGTPDRTETTPVVGWDAGGNSVDALDGNLRLTWQMPAAPVDAVLGLRSAEQRGVADTNPMAVAYGFRMLSAGGTPVVAAWEHGVEATTRRSYTLDDTFEIQRVGDTVVYKINGNEVRRARGAMRGPMITTGCMYMSGDALPSGCGGSAGGGSDDCIVLENGVTVTGLSATSDGESHRSWLCFQLDLPDGAAELAVALAGGTGDFDLSITDEPYPAVDTFDDIDSEWFLAHELDATGDVGNVDQATAEDLPAGTYYVYVLCWETGSGVTLTATWN